jgi:hypothetical protein
MGRVLKYELGYGEALTHIPEGAEILHVATQPIGPTTAGVYAWALVDPDAAHVVRQIGYFATGDEIPAGSEYVGTAVTPSGAFVWHVFEAPARDGSAA